MIVPLSPFLPLSHLLQTDEYVVYTLHQQRMQYLVEFSLPGDMGHEEVEEVEEKGEKEVGEVKKEAADLSGAVEGTCVHVQIL